MLSLIHIYGRDEGGHQGLGVLRHEQPGRVPQHNGNDTVSYTHLDVYKRQFLNWLVIMGMTTPGN